MNWPLLTGAGLLLLAAAVHGIIGDRFLRKIAPDALPPNALGGPANSRSLVRVSWHFVTVTFAASGLALFGVGFDGMARSGPGIVWFLGALFSCLALFSVSASIQRHRHHFLFRHPAPLGLTAVAVLIWWGATSA